MLFDFGPAHVWLYTCVACRCYVRLKILYIQCKYDLGLNLSIGLYMLCMYACEHSVIYVYAVIYTIKSTYLILSIIILYVHICYLYS